jgi:predicted ribosome quality control (RQC) complex YloA/Tae2 family protein
VASHRDQPAFHSHAEHAFGHRSAIEDIRKSIAEGLPNGQPPPVLHYLVLMTMRWDPILTAAVAAELNEALAGARLTGIFLDHGATTLHVYFRDRTVLVDLTPKSLGLEVLEKSAPPEGSRTFPCILGSVQSIPDERVLVFVLTRIRGLGGPVRIVVDFVPSRSNASVAEGDDWTVRHVLVPRSGTRAPRIGSPYPKPSSDRRGVSELLALRDWLEILEAEETLAGRRQLLLHKVAFTSSLNADALVIGSDEGGGQTSLQNGYVLWSRLREIALGTGAGHPAGAGAGQSRSAAFVLRCEWGDQPYPVELPGPDLRTAASLLAAVAEVRRAAGAGAVLTPSRWTDVLKRTLRASGKRLGKLTRELAATADPQSLRSQADMILAHLHLVKRGATEATFTGFEGTPETIVLDPTLSPQKNAERYYDRAGRADRARANLPSMIQDAESHVAELSQLLDRVLAGAASEEEVRGALPEPGGGGRGRPDPSTPVLPYRLYRTSGGLEVRVGRGAKANDQLTFKHSAPNDIWLHARHSAGAHVVLRWTTQDSPPSRDLEEAAILAALHSKARSSGSVPVDWTRRKYVRKPRKSPPGRVQLDRAKTLFVEPDPSLLDRLKLGE